MMTKRQSAVTFLAICGIVVGVAVFPICRLLLAGLPAVVHDTVLVSPDGTYTATLHDVDTGAAGSYCQARLRKTSDKDNETVLVDGGYKFVDKVEWSSSHTLTVTTDLEGPPEPSWPKSWQGVKIKYKW